ncbi:MAG: UDP-N-acetylmuramate--L-alanine ligase [Bacteroidia bacterium]|nr:UDP-N-acetylmuramate--L-alanine ligase [Bacteroidia bacterium]MDW8302445.1 UDP-N-acetylmuramate--L-alanine ligase [Bacteroidia bacterium]
MNIDLSNIKKVYFIGIGGIGMSALARYFKAQGAIVEGYDRNETALTQQLVKEGIKVYHDIDTDHLTEDTDIFIYTPAVKPEENEELAYLIAQEAPLYKRAEVLGAIANQYKCIAIAGAHGKTSTATIITHILNHCGVGASAFLGGISKNYGTNYIQGDSEWLVVEADEYDRSFLQLNPYISVVTSVDPDHLDIYGTKEKVQEAYKQFIEKTNPEGAILYYDNDADLRKIITSIKKIPRVSYGVEDAADYTADNIVFKYGKFTFDILKHGEDYLSNFKLNISGWHNLLNVMAGITLAEILGLDKEAVKEAVASYQGVERRFEVHPHPECTIIDDYAHHPEEIRKTLESVKRMYPTRKIMAVFQPHLYSRTQHFYKEFAEALSLAHKVVLLPIYPAREQPIEGVSAELIFREVKSPSKQLIDYDNAASYIYLKSKTYPVVVIMGAGDIDQVAKKVIQKYKNLPA